MRGRLLTSNGSTAFYEAVEQEEYLVQLAESVQRAHTRDEGKDWEAKIHPTFTKSEFRKAEEQVMADHILLDADSHVSEPLNLWQERLPKKYRDIAPHMETAYKGQP